MNAIDKIKKSGELDRLISLLVYRMYCPRQLGLHDWYKNVDNLCEANTSKCFDCWEESLTKKYK